MAAEIALYFFRERRNERFRVTEVRAIRLEQVEWVRRFVEHNADARNIFDFVVRVVRLEHWFMVISRDDKPCFILEYSPFGATIERVESRHRSRVKQTFTCKEYKQRSFSGREASKIIEAFLHVRYDAVEHNCQHFVYRFMDAFRK